MTDSTEKNWHIIHHSGVPYRPDDCKGERSGCECVLHIDGALDILQDRSKHGPTDPALRVALRHIDELRKALWEKDAERTLFTDLLDAERDKAETLSSELESLRNACRVSGCEIYEDSQGSIWVRNARAEEKEKQAEKQVRAVEAQLETEALSSDAYATRAQDLKADRDLWKAETLRLRAHLSVSEAQVRAVTALCERAQAGEPQPKSEGLSAQERLYVPPIDRLLPLDQQPAPSKPFTLNPGDLLRLMNEAAASAKPSGLPLADPLIDRLVTERDDLRAKLSAIVSAFKLDPATVTALSQNAATASRLVELEMQVDELEQEVERLNTKRQSS